MYVVVRLLSYDLIEDVSLAFNKYSGSSVRHNYTCQETAKRGEDARLNVMSAAGGDSIQRQ